MLNGRSADPPSATGFFLHLFSFIAAAAMFIRTAYWLIGPRNVFWDLERLAWFSIVGPLFILTGYPIGVLAYDTLMHFVPRPLQRARSWDEGTRRQAEANTAIAAFASIAFTVFALLLNWLIQRIEDPISLVLLVWTYRLTLACLAITASAALLGFYVARRYV